MTARTLLLIGSLVSSGLMAGFFFSWAVSVIPGTKLVDDHTYISTMQNINRAILNPLFLATFVVTPVVLAGAAILHIRAGYSRQGAALAAAATTYLLGVFAVTAGGNVPLNDALDAFDLRAASVDDAMTRRTTYETTWNRWHNLRTVASIVSLALVASASVMTEVD